jgi:hypothetical protein
VDDAFGVDVLDCVDDLNHVELDFRLAEYLAAFEQFVEGLGGGSVTLLVHSSSRM